MGYNACVHICFTPYMYLCGFFQFLERGKFGDVKRARWNEKVVAVKYFSSQDKKGGFSEEVRHISYSISIWLQISDTS